MELRGKIISGRVPPGGWHYTHPDGDVTRSDSLEGLCEAILDYRISNGIDVGNVYYDLEQQICGKHPTQCRPGAVAAPMHTDGSKKVKVIDQIARWASKIAGLAHRKVDQGTADKRAQICAACPENVEWKEGCQNCVRNAERMTSLIRGANDVANWKQLHACRVLGVCTRTAIWLDIGLVGSSTKLPPNCWRRNA